MRFRRSAPPEVSGPTLTFCEPVTATPTSRVHIRLRLADEEPRLGGGIIGAALCDYDVTRGWDIPGEVTQERAAFRLGAETGPTCPECYRRTFGEPR